MANSDHLKIIKKGVEGWNKWRKENPDSKPDLGWANLIGLDLNDALFKDSNFKLAFCKECSLIEVDFSDSNLYGTNFENSILTNSNLENANLEGAHLVNADLTGVNLRGANLKLANLDGSLLIDADMLGAKKLKASQLLNVKSLKNTKLDSHLLEKISEVAPHLLE